MLVLNRRVGESLIIDSTITIKVVSCRGNQVRLGIEALDNTPIYRQELLERMQSDSNASAGQQFAEITEDN